MTAGLWAALGAGERGEGSSPGLQSGLSSAPLGKLPSALPLIRLRFSQRAILGLGAAFQLQQETIKKFVLFLVQEKWW